MVKDCTHLTVRPVSMLMHNHIVYNNMPSEESVWANLGVWYDLLICSPILGGYIWKRSSGHGREKGLNFEAVGVVILGDGATSD